jgi:hypothetical protein
MKTGVSLNMRIKHGILRLGLPLLLLFQLFVFVVFVQGAAPSALRSKRSPNSVNAQANTPTPTPSTSFPSTAVLDNFNRANGAIGSNWSGGISGYNISTNQLHITSGGDIYWNPTNFGSNQEAYETLTNIDTSGSEIDLLLKAQNLGYSGNGELEVSYDPVGHQISVWTYTNTGGWVQQGSNIPITLINGDQFGARALVDGTVGVYRNGLLLGTRNVASWPYYTAGGYVGLWTVNASATVIDDFGGGGVVSGPVATPTPTNTPTATSTNTPTSTPTRTQTPTATSTSTQTKIPTAISTNTPSSTPTVTSTIVPSQTPTNTPLPTKTPTATAVGTPTATQTPVPSATPTPIPTPTPTGLPSATPITSGITTFSVNTGGVDVIPHQIIRTTADRLYLFGYAGDSSTTLEAYWTTAPGLPNTTTDFAGAASLAYPAIIISVSPVYDGANIVHIITNTDDGKLTDIPFDTSTNTFKTAKVLDTGLQTTYFNTGTSGVSGGMDSSGTMHVAYWSAGNHITYRTYTYNSSTDTLTLTGGPIQLDGAESSNNNHPSLAVSPLDNSVTVAWVSGLSGAGNIWSRTKNTLGTWLPATQVNSSPAWTGTNSGLSIDQGPALIIDGSGTRYLSYVENYRITLPYDYGRAHYVINNGSGWNDTYIGYYTHDPALAFDNAGNVYIIGHGYPLNPSPCTSTADMCLYPRNPNGTWGAPQIIAAHTGSNSFDDSPSTKWSAVGNNRPETVEFLFTEVINGTSSTSNLLHYGRIALANQTPTPTPNPLPSATPTKTPTATATRTPTATAPNTSTPTSASTPTATSPSTPTPTAPNTPTPTTASILLLGTQTIGSNQDSNPAGTAEAFVFTASSSGTVHSLSVYIDSSNTATQVLVGLYNNTASNTPGNLLTYGTISTPAKGAWNTVTVPNASVTSGVMYWIAVLGPVSAGTVQFRDVGSGGASQVSLQTNLASLPATWSPGTTYFNSPLSAYAQ